MTRGFEEEHRDVLQNIEFAIVGVFRDHPDLLDYHVEAALKALISEYKAEHQGHPRKPVTLQEHRRRVYEAVKGMCEWRLGRGALEAEADDDGPEPQPKSLEEIGTCLRTIHRSVLHWNKHGGRQGYLNFVQPFLV